MKRLFIIGLVTAVVACALGLAMRSDPPSSDSIQQQSRHARHIRMAESGSTRTPREVDALPLLELDEPEQAMAQALEASKPSEQEIVAYYEEHREIFGSRSLEQSRDVVGRIVRHQKAAERLRASD